MTSIAKYGVEFPASSDIIKQRVKIGFMKRYGVDNNMKSEIGLKNWKKAFKEKHGVDSPFKDPAIRKMMHRKYAFDNMQFDSAPELALYVWLKDHNIEFEY